MKVKTKNLLACIATGAVVVGFCMVLINPSELFASYDYSYKEVEGGIAISAAPEAVGSNLEIPSQVDGKTVVKIESGAFKNTPHVTTLIVPQTVTNIEYGAFSGLKHLETLTIPFVGTSANATGVEKTLGYMFGNAADTGAYTIQAYSETGREGFYIPRHLTAITVQGGSLGYGSFSNCKSLETVTLASEDVTEIPEYAFQSTSALESVTLPNSVTRIGDKAFYRSGVQVVNLSGITQIGDEAFVDTDIESLNIGNVQTIGNKAFYGMGHLQRIVFGESLKSIGEYAFAHCGLLTEANLPASVTTIGKGVFYQNSRLATITCDSTYFTVEDNVLYRKEKNELLVYPAGKTGTTFVVPDSVSVIEEQAFNGNKYLQSITVSENTNSIGYAAFSACPSLTTLNVYFSGSSANAEGAQAHEGYVFGELPFENCETKTATVGSETYYYCFPKNVTVKVLGQ